MQFKMIKRPDGQPVPEEMLSPAQVAQLLESNAAELVSRSAGASWMADQGFEFEITAEPGDPPPFQWLKSPQG